MASNNCKRMYEITCRCYILFLIRSVSPLDQEVSKSHESVFRESGDHNMAMLTIGLKVSPFKNNNQVLAFLY